MGDLTKNLSRHEFACDCGCGFDTVDFKLATGLQIVCDHFAQYGKVRIDITGGNRCEKRNNETDGAVPGSSHTKAKAADFKIFVNGQQVDPEMVALFCEQRFKVCGLGRYHNRTHLDFRGWNARWDMRNGNTSTSYFRPSVVR